MPEDTEEQNDDEPTRTPGSVPTEGRTINRPAPNPATQFAEYLAQQLGYTR